MLNCFFRGYLDWILQNCQKMRTTVLWVRISPEMNLGLLNSSMFGRNYIYLEFDRHVKVYFLRKKYAMKFLHISQIKYIVESRTEGASLKKYLYLIISFYSITLIHIHTHAHRLSLPPSLLGGCPRGVMVKAMDCGIVVSEFVLQSRYYVQFRANTLGKGINPLILPAMG